MGNKINFCRMSKVAEHMCLFGVAKRSELYDDMVDQIELVLAEKGADVTSNERDLLILAFGNLIRKN